MAGFGQKTIYTVTISSRILQILTTPHGSGTALSGIIAANSTNNIGIYGIDWYAYIMPVVTEDNDGAGSCISLCRGIYYAVNNGTDIIMIGNDMNTESKLLYDLIDYAYHCGCIIIAPSESDQSISQNSFLNDQRVITVTPWWKTI